MGSKLLGKVMAGAGLGAASLLICAPGTALADGGPYDWEDGGHIYTVPKGVKAGHKFKIILKCDRPVEKPWVSSKVTGKVWLKPLEDGVRVPDDVQPPTPPNGGQPPLPPNGGQPPLPPNGEQPPLPPNGGQPPLPPNGEQPPLPPDGGQPPLPDGAQPAAPDGADEGAGAQPEGGQGGQAAYGHEATYWGWAKVSYKTKPGHYSAWGACDGRGKIIVLPKGWVHGGDGGASTDQSRVAAGAGLLGAAALGGFLMIRRRRTDGSLA
ncbi:hypothetical protein ACN27G_23720 [Plantactinospora sp. WMMB334]|uniref:hypothetical protein n=1 Tax=Plantactinospora sp. WMMB334 TaxID=3404119 RepID=UPI003B95014C